MSTSRSDAGSKSQPNVHARQDPHPACYRAGAKYLCRRSNSSQTAAFYPRRLSPERGSAPAIQHVVQELSPHLALAIVQIATALGVQAIEHHKKRACFKLYQRSAAFTDHKMTTATASLTASDLGNRERQLQVQKQLRPKIPKRKEKLLDPPHETQTITSKRVNSRWNSSRRKSTAGATELQRRGASFRSAWPDRR